MKMATWRQLIQDEMRLHGESLTDTPYQWVAGPNVYDWEENHPHHSVDFSNDSWLDIEFDDGFGRSEGVHFTLWTDKRVYFPVVYDGAEDCGSVSRHPCDVPQCHVGG